MRKSIPGGILLALTVSLAGCSSSLQDAYVLEERIPSLAAGAEGAGYYAEPFAEDLCVVTDESAFDEGLVTSEAAALFDEDGREVLYSKDAFERLYPASITKVMTALVALEYGNLSDQVTVTEDPLEVFDKDPGGRFLGKHDSIAVSKEQVLGTDPSDQHEIGLALGIYYDDCSYGVSSSVQDSLFIGMEVDGYNSISISRYAGGDGIICVFGGDFPPNVKETAHSNILKVFFSGLSYDSKVIMLKCSSKDPGSVEIPLGLDEGEDVVVFVFCGTMLGTFGETHRIMSEVGTESSGDEAQTSGDSIKGITRMETGGRKP